RIFEVFVKVATGITETATAVGSVDRPAHNFLPVFLLGIKSNDRSEILFIVGKFYIVIELFFDGERLDIFADGMGRCGGEHFVIARFNFRKPVICARTAFVIEIAANPLEKFVSSFFSGDEKGVMEADETGAAFHLVL